ncbi:MAG: cytochrome-c peroxidase [Methylococcaceae bacterium]|nr:cytochrome-c peroxidase [Methylococcaceae bacterium]
MKKLTYICLVTLLSPVLHAKSIDSYVVNDNDFYPRNSSKEELGKLLMFDKILSGNQNISCASCHHPFTDTGDGLSLPVGEGGQGLGVVRDTGSDSDAIIERVPRNAPHLFNVGAKEFNTLFFDGRVKHDVNQVSGFMTPAGNNLPIGLDNPLAAQAMFPVTSATEMAGQAGENPIANAASIDNLAGNDGVWNLLAERLRNNPEYVALFVSAYDDINQASDITFVHAANAISAFEAKTARCTNTLFDRYVQDDEKTTVSQEVLEGAEIFYNTDKGNCASCHSGPFQTDQKFHAIGVPQIGPGKGDNLPGYTDGHDDFGLERVTANPADRFKFRTPTLRQIAFTGPWGHDGAYSDLEAMVRHHLNPVTALNNYTTNNATLISRPDLNAIDFVAQNDPVRRAAIEAAIEIEPRDLSDEEITKLMAFLNYGLTDFDCLNLNKDIPARVPSGLPVAD